MGAILVSPHQAARLEEHLLLIRRMLHEAAPTGTPARLAAASTCNPLSAIR